MLGLRLFMEMRQSMRRSAILGGATLCLAVVAISLAFILRPEGHVEPRRAVIIDQLSFTDPHAEFIDETTAMLSGAGYDVDYVPPEQVTVDFYRELPTRGYEFIIVRSHSSWERPKPPSRASALNGAPTQSETIESVVGLFTNEPYSSTAHVDEQRAYQLSVMSYPGVAAQFFGIQPEFVRDEVRGDFDGATFVLMGCAGLSSTPMAQALVGRGVSHFISWDDEVTAAHTDRATQQLLKYMLNGSDAGDAVAQAMADVGPDPAFGSRLAAYPW